MRQSFDIWYIASPPVIYSRCTPLLLGTQVSDIGPSWSSCFPDTFFRITRSTTLREDRYLTNWTLRQSRVTDRQLRDHLRTTTSTLISDQTVRNRLRANNLRPRRPVVRPPLLQRHRATRQDCCTRPVRWQRAQWSSFLFSDESRFALQFNDDRERLYRRPGERFADVNVNQRLPFGGGSVMVWGAFLFNDWTPLYAIERKSPSVYPALCYTCAPTYWCGGRVSR